MPGTTADRSYTDEQLSRVHDAGNACRHVDTYCNTDTFSAFWNALPKQLQFEFNNYLWTCVPKR